MADDLNVNVNLKGDASGLVDATNQASKAVESLAAKLTAQYAQINAVALRTKEIVANVFVGEPITAVQKYADNLRLVAQSTNAWGTTQKAFFNSLTTGWVQTGQQVLAFKNITENAMTSVAQKTQQTQKAMFDGFRQGFADAAANAQRVSQLRQNMSMASLRAMYANSPMQGPQLPAGVVGGGSSVVSSLGSNLSLINLFNKGLSSSIAGLGAYGFAAVKAGQLVVGAFNSMMNTYTKTGDAIYGLKLITNDTTEQVSALNYAANKFGVSSLSLQMRWAQAAKHLVDNNKWIKALGIEYKNLDGTTKPVIDMLGEMGDKLNAMADSEKREAAAMAIFGRGYKDILPILVQGSAGMEKLRKEAERYGMVWSDEDLQKERAFAMSKRELSAAFQGLVNTLAQKFAPILSAIIRKMAEWVGWVTHMWKASEGFRNALKIIGLVLLGLSNPIVGFIALVVVLVQHFAIVGEVIVGVSEMFGSVLGKGIAVAAKAFQYLLDIAFKFADGFLTVGEVLTGNRFWKAVFGDGANEGIKNARATLDGVKTAMDSAIDGFAQSAWDNGGKWAKRFGEGAVDFMKKLKLPKPGSSDFNLGWGGGEVDPDPNAKGGGGGKNRLLEYFKQMVENARASLNALVEEAKNAKKQMDDTTAAVRDALRKAFDITALADETGGGRSGAGMIALFKRRLEAMRGFVTNVRKLRDMGIPADWLSEIVSAGVDKGASLAQMLVSQPGVLSQLTELRSQMNVETQAAGEMVGQAMFGDKIADAISRSTTYQQQFQKLLLAGRSKGYKPTDEDVAAATQSIANTVYMNVGTNADPYAIENAIAWALKTGVGSGYRRPQNTGTGGAPMSVNAPYRIGATFQNQAAEFMTGLFAGSA